MSFGVKANSSIIGLVKPYCIQKVMLVCNVFFDIIVERRELKEVEKQFIGYENKLPDSIS